MPIYQIRMVHYDGLRYDVLVQIEADSPADAEAKANRKAFGTKWWPQQPRLKTWGRQNYGCKPKKVRSD